jgi:hypothetical protein
VKTERINYEQHFQESADKRTAFWEKLGKLDPYVITHAINPSFMGGPRWPSLRQAFLTIETPTGSIIASDGLSDPYDDYDTNPKSQPYNGLGIEIYLESPEKPQSSDRVKNSWQFNIVYQMSQLAAENGNFITLIQDYKCISTELYNVEVPKQFLNKEGRVGVLLGIESKTVPPTLALSIETVLMVNVKLLTLAELDYIVANSEEGRLEIAQKIASQKDSGASYFDRPSVV